MIQSWLVLRNPTTRRMPGVVVERVHSHVAEVRSLLAPEIKKLEVSFEEIECLKDSSSLSLEVTPVNWRLMSVEMEVETLKSGGFTADLWEGGAGVEEPWDEG